MIKPPLECNKSGGRRGVGYASQAPRAAMRTSSVTSHTQPYRARGTQSGRKFGTCMRFFDTPATRSTAGVARTTNAVWRACTARERDAHGQKIAMCLTQYCTHPLEYSDHHHHTASHADTPFQPHFTRDEHGVHAPVLQVRNVNKTCSLLCVPVAEPLLCTRTVLGVHAEPRLLPSFLLSTPGLHGQ